MNSHTHRRALMAVMLVLAGGIASTKADTDARAIIEQSQKLSDSRSQRYEGILQVLDGGKSSEKRWAFARIGAHGQSKVVIRFSAPADVKGIALLIVNHPDKSSDQWMWTPALERDRRIALQDRSTRFFGTDFSFEDLEERDVDQYDYTLAGDDVVAGVPAWKIQATPRQSKTSQYTKTVLWILKDHYTLAQVESYVKGEIVRRLVYSDIRPIQGFWTAHEMEMTDLRRHSVTKLSLRKVEYNVPIKDDSFTVQALRRQ